MRTQSGAAFLGLLLLCSAAAAAREKIYAPLPDKVIAAKTVFLVNDSGAAKFADALYREVKDWNRWQVVTDRGKADLVLVLSRQETVAGVISTASATAVGQTVSGSGVAVPVATQRWYLHVLDSKTGEKLWTADATMGGKLWRSWGSIAKSLLSDIQKRLRDVK
jgi:predicted Zn-dependent protease